MIGTDVITQPDLLATILANPTDDLPRLVYADWLEEHGESDRAELIRIQIEIAVGSDLLPLRVRERQLLASANPWQRRRDWVLAEIPDLDWPSDVGGWEWHRGFPEVWRAPLPIWLQLGQTVGASTPLRRVVPIDREPYVPNADPRRPGRGWLRKEGVWTERQPEECFLPPTIFDLLEPDLMDFAMFDHIRVYPTRAAAMDALSEACLAWAVPVPAR